ncbi:ABC transporter substrate-binding protein [Bosea sp. TND4EK4]|uniref:ABC transporter substrate-binding protein n=1 Tax=Bosea sp. TND4EK4 TaxID=1907408 RepID=UPI0009564EC1|nr:ABC transporter substrate-binding protein [Bosea sp. TND4EK4]SIQ51538.1 peptide/nickel transport system substrate-binding protein [Bosea sp. TND4EK4]
MTHFDRRQFLRLGAAAGGTLALPGFSVAQADTRPSITIAVQKVVNTNTLETLREQSNVGTRVLSNMLEPLIATDWLGDLSLQPGLATGWRRLDERTVELTLREGVTFHDGEPMTAEDVAFSFGAERMWGGAAEAGAAGLFGSVTAGQGGKQPPAEVVAVAKRAFPAFERIEIVGPRTVRFVNKTPDITLEGRISRNVGVIVSRKAFAAAPSWLDWARKPVGTGPYKVAEFKPDQSLTLVAHDAYWGGRPPLKQIRFVEVPEIASRINGLRSGEYDFACDIPPDQIGDIAASGRHEVLGGLIANHRLTVFDKSHPLLESPLIRRAMTHAIDRQAIVEALWAGRTQVPKGLQFDFYGPMLIQDWAVPAYDMALARKLVKESGYKGDPIPYRLLNNYYTGQVATAQILVESWREAGLNVAVEMKENFPQVLAKGPSRAVRDWSNSASYNDPVSSIVAQHGPTGQQWQIGEWRNEEMGKLSGVLETSMDMGQRKAAFRRMLEICEREDPAYTVLHQTANFTAKRKDIRWKTGQSFAMDFRAANWGGMG